MSENIPTNADERALYWEQKHELLLEELAKVEAELKETQKKLKLQQDEPPPGWSA